MWHSAGVTPITTAAWKKSAAWKKEAFIVTVKLPKRTHRCSSICQRKHLTASKCSANPTNFQVLAKILKPPSPLATDLGARWNQLSLDFDVSAAAFSFPQLHLKYFFAASSSPFTFLHALFAFLPLRFAQQVNGTCSFNLHIDEALIVIVRRRATVNQTLFTSWSPPKRVLCVFFACSASPPPDHTPCPAAAMSISELILYARKCNVDLCSGM